MKLVKRTDAHKVYQRRDSRYSVTTLKGKKINGEEKTAVLLALDLIKTTATKPTEETSIKDTATDGNAE